MRKKMRKKKRKDDEDVEDENVVEMIREGDEGR